MLRLLARIMGVIVLSVVPTPLSASTENVTFRGTGGSYCGLYSLYAAAKSLNRPIPFEQLLQDKYIASKNGSSLEELETAAIDHGLHCQATRSMSPSALRSAKCPILLHVRPAGKGTQYNHWILFLGVDETGANALIIDPPSDVTPMPLSEVCALWDGIALMVSDHPDSFTSPRIGSWLNQFLAIAFVGAFVALGTFCRKPSSSISRIGILITIGLIAPVIWHALHPDGLFDQRVAVAQVAGHYFRPNLPEVDLSVVEAALGDPNVTILDARTPEAFRYGHIDGAINLPVFTGVSQRSQLLAQISHTTRLIIYCQSDRCSWAESLGSDLALRGYSVFLFPQGYNGWKKYRDDR